jgi:23S rRNA (adenine2030-N6)-methyltransferase
MNYRHAFHAGGFTDVVKHLIVSRIVLYLERKQAAFRVLDTHAGAGLYDFGSEEAQRSPEWRDGIARLMQQGLGGEAGALAASYLEVVRGLNPGGELKVYPGSPLIVRRLMRPQDRLFALELHPVDVARLKALFAGDLQVRVTELDGWAALGTHLPPKEKRGLVLIDPPFEERGEFERLVEGLVKAHRRFAGGTYALWYPLKVPREAADFAAGLKSTGIARILRAELTVRAPASPPRLYGTGMAIINPPFTLEAELKLLLPALARLLGDAGKGGWRLDWLVRE